MCGSSILSCCPCNPHGHERALKEEEGIHKLNKVIIYGLKVAKFCKRYAFIFPVFNGLCNS